MKINLLTKATETTETKAIAFIARNGAYAVSVDAPKNWAFEVFVWISENLLDEINEEDGSVYLETIETTLVELGWHYEPSQWTK